MNEPPFIVVDEITRTRFLKFTCIGVIAFLIDVVVFQSVLSLSSVSLYAARVVSFVLAASAAWWMHRTFTFHDAENARADLQWARFLAANLVGGSVSYAIFVLMIVNVPLAASYPVLALAAGSVSGVAFNFTAYLRYVFRTGTGSSTPF